MPHDEASLRVQTPNGGTSERVQMTNLQDKKEIINRSQISVFL